MTQLCVSLTDETTAQIIERMQRLAGIADVFEIRGDSVLDLDLLAILRAKTEPLLFTARPVSQGGRWDDADDRRRLILLEAAKRGYDYVDVELESGYLDVALEKAGRGLVLSHHDLQGTPDNLEGLYERMCEVGADIVKIATTPRSVAEVGRLLAFARGVKERGGPPLIAIAMGPLGLPTRILAGRYDAPFTFASPARGAEAAPGQIPAELMADLYRVRQVGASTKVYGVLGSQAERSLSPILHNRALEAAGLDAVYVPLVAEALPAFMEALPELGLAGFSVTRPFKSEIIQYLDEVDETAALCGSVNTVVVHEGVLQGSTSDGIGILAPLKRKVDVKGRPAVVLGAGGAARAAALALLRRGAQVTLLARDPDKAAEVAAQLGCGSGALTDIKDVAWEVLLNATPVGSAPNVDETPIPADAHRADSVVFDMVYDPLETRLLREARAAGASVIDGIEMLVAQAVVQFETWTGRDAPVEVMRSAAQSAARGTQE